MKHPKYSEDNLVWLDLEMTGLDVETDKIIEIAIIITDAQLNIIAESQSIAIHHSDDTLANMNEWCVETHGNSGLTERVRQSNISERQAEMSMLEFVRDYVPENSSPLCGNSIWQDRRFLAKYMPDLEQYFHYRLLDVSTLKILASKWYPSVLEKVSKQSSHLALDDIRDSINELNTYRSEILI